VKRTYLLCVVLWFLPCIASAQTVLLVDDDDDMPDVVSYWEDALNTLGLTYTTVSTGTSGNGPTAADMASYDVVVWFSGDSYCGTCAGPNATDETELETYLDAGGSLLLSSQDYLYENLSVTNFMLNYLGVDSSCTYTCSDSGMGPLLGIVGDFISDAYPTPGWDINTMGMTEFSDDLIADATAVDTFESSSMYGTGIGVIRKETADYRTMFYGTAFTPFFADPAEGSDILYDCIRWLAYGECDPLDQDGDGYSGCDGDCDDTDATIYPSAQEICNDGIDQNCDGQLNEADDSDGDGYTNCDTPSDCDDFDANAYPGLAETCDFVDNDCDGVVDNGFDQDNDGYTTCDGDCDDTAPTVYPGAAEACNGVDDDCDGTIDEATDDDSDGYTICNGDCDDNDHHTYPFAPEICDQVDNDCDGVVPADETWDGDGDGYVECEDCDDNDAAFNPGALEICDGLDNNCDGDVDEGLDGDGDGYSTC